MLDKDNDAGEREAIPNYTRGHQNAFPCGEDVDPETTAAGMTMREWYAGQALAGLLGSYSGTSNPEPAEVGRLCFAYADAMLAQAAQPEAE